MKNLFTLIILAFTSAFVIAQTEITDNIVIEKVQNASDGGPIMTFEAMEVDYGVIEQNGEPLRVLKFTNTGDEPLVIKNCKGSCGCTVPEWAKEPIMPGEESEIKIRYATNRLGKFSKTVTITTNEGDVPHVITVKGEVLQPNKEESVPSGQPSMINDGE